MGLSQRSLCCSHPSHICGLSELQESPSRKAAVEESNGATEAKPDVFNGSLDTYTLSNRGNEKKTVCRVKLARSKGRGKLEALCNKTEKALDVALV